MRKRFIPKGRPVFETALLPQCSFFDIAAEFGHNLPLHRFLSLMRKMRARSYAREQLALAGELLEEHELTELKKEVECQSEVCRLTFFQRDFSEIDFRYATDEDILGYAVIRRIRAKDPGNPFELVHIYEAVVKRPTLLNNYHHARHNFQTYVGPQSFRVTGSLFCQQSGVTGVCAHAALRMLVSTKQGRMVSNKTILKAAYTALTGDDTDDPLKLIGATDGLTTDVMQKTTEVLGLKPYVLSSYSHDTKMSPAAETQSRPWTIHDLYVALEGDIPGLLMFADTEQSEEGHVVFVLGHTLNSDLWNPSAEPVYFEPSSNGWYSSATFADNFLINDDNFGMYLATSTRTFDSHFALAMVFPDVALGENHVDPISAEIYSVKYLQRVLDQMQPAFGAALHPQARKWFDQMIRVMPSAGGSKSGLVVRTILTDREKVLKHLKEASDLYANMLLPTDLRACKSVMPENCYLCEISICDLYATNKRKIADVVVPVTHSDMLQECEISLVRLPQWLILDPMDRLGKFEVRNTTIVGHVPLFRSGWDGPVPEW